MINWVVRCTKPEKLRFGLCGVLLANGTRWGSGGRLEDLSWGDLVNPSVDKWLTCAPTHNPADPLSVLDLAHPTET